MATVREIAKLAGVSPSTVSRVLNDTAPVGEKARNKVLSAIHRLNGQQKNSSGAFANRTIGIIIPSASGANLAGHPALYTIIIRFIEVLNEHQIGNTMILLDENTSLDKKELAVDAYLAVGTSEAQEASLLPMLIDRKVPFMFINRQIEHKNVSFIHVDDEQATEIAVNYLLKLGHKKIAFVGGNKDYRNTKLRYSSYAKTLRAVGIEPDEKHVIYGEYSELSGYEMIQKIISLDNPPTAACAASDSIAIGCMRYLKEQGYNLPQDFSIIGFGNIEAAEYVTPSLTTISQNSDDMGRIAGNALIQMLNNPTICRQEILIRSELVVRGSCTENK